MLLTRLNDRKKGAMMDTTNTLHFTPVTLLFNPPLPPSTFRRLVNVIEQGQEPLRLWGNPIRLGGQKVHVYGIDLHLWTRITLEITPGRMIIVLPQETDERTIHRLMTNIQRYLSPATVEVFVGDVKYNGLTENEAPVWSEEHALDKNTATLR